MTKDSEKWLNLFLAVEDIEKIKKSFNNLTTEMLHQKIINLHNELNKKAEKNKNQALEITKLLEQKKKTNELFINQSHCVLDMTAMLEHQKAKSLEAIKENERLYNYSMEQAKEIEDLKDKLNQANRIVKVGIDNSAELVNFLDKKDEIIKQKNTIISYLESKLK